MREEMRPGFIKEHYGDGLARHFLSTPDEPWMDPHDHPGYICTEVEQNSYIEEIYNKLDGSTERVHRHQGDVFYIQPTTIHKIVELPDGQCITKVKYGPHVHLWRFWRWIDGVAQSRLPHEGWPD